MLASIFFVPDMHKRDIDFTSIKGYTEASKLVHNDIMEYIKTLENPVLVFLGDLFDKGFRSIGRAFCESYYVNEMVNAVNGNAYLCIGNHFFIERDANPEMYLIQPSRYFQPKIDYPATEPLLKTVPYVVIGNVQISFFHFDKMDKNYIQPRLPNVEYHVGVYHDDCVLPSDIRQLAGYFGTTSNDYLNNIFANIDLAIFGHVHVAVGLRIFTLNNGKQVPMFIPGSLGITSNHEPVKHKSVECPVLFVGEDTFEISYKEISTHMEVLKFYENNKDKTLVNKTNYVADTEIVNKPAVSLLDYLRKHNYNMRTINYIMNESSPDLMGLIQFLEGGVSDNVTGTT